MTNKDKTAIQKNVVSQVEQLHGRLLLAPRVGKTKIAIMAIKKFKPESILWVTPSAKLSKVDIPEEFEKWGAKRYLKKLTTVTYSSLSKIKGYFELIILDEEQALTELNSIALFDRLLDYESILSMTGTPTKHKNKLELYKQLELEILYEMPINEAVDMGILANYEVTVLMINPIKELLTKYNRIQAAINSKTMAKVVFDGEGMLTLTGGLNGTLGLAEKTSKYGGRLFAIIGASGSSLGYFVIQDDGTYTGKVTLEGVLYRITKDKLHTPYHASLLIGRKQAIGNSELKEVVTKALIEELKDTKKLIFCNSIAQAEEIHPNATYHSKTDNTKLLQFQKDEIDTIAMVNTGGTGYTYKNLDNLILVQCDSDKNGSTSQKICRTLLSQKNYIAKIWLLCIKDTQDEVWVQRTLASFDKSKIIYKHLKSITNGIQSIPQD
tara:strand:+ start:33009 stop:34322 length:1314 start_codon:yes stop_codon:yes gene_type:complete